MLKLASAIGIVLLLVAVAPVAQADTIIEQPVELNWIGTISDWNPTPTLHGLADQFQPSADATITSLTWYGHWLRNFTVAPTALNFELWIFEDDGGVPTSVPIFSQSVAASVTDSTLDTPLLTFPGPPPISVYGTDIYEFTTPIGPLPVSGGSTYWLSIALNDPSVDRFAFGQWHWSRAVSEPSDYFAFHPTSNPTAWYVTLLNQQFGGVDTGDLAFTLEGTVASTVPLPSAAWLGFGLLGLLSAARRIKRKKA